MSYPKWFADNFKQQLAYRGIALSRASEHDSINEAYELSAFVVDVTGAVGWDSLITELKSRYLMDYRCSKCGRQIVGAIPEADACGFVYCDECADKHLAYCEGCDERCPKHAMVKTEDGYYCQHCYEHNQKRGAVSRHEAH